MRNMSFSHTKEQIRNRTKTVTRRHVDTWKHLKVGDRLQAVEQVQGLKKGEHPVKLAVIEVVSISTPTLGSISLLDVGLEGFPGWSCQDFVEFFIRQFPYTAGKQVRRIEFKYIEAEGWAGSGKEQEL